MHSLSLIIFLASHIFLFTDAQDVTTMQNSSGDCSGSAREFPPDVFTDLQKRQGVILLHILGFIYAFTVIAIVCRDYFLPSIHCICKDWKIPKDVAAATFMATATCMPEMFVNVIGTFVTNSDLGVGSIVGSSVYDSLAVVGLSGLAAPKVINLEWWPVTRDCTIYVLATSLMVTTLWDSVVRWYEAIPLLIFYFVYLGVMCYNRSLYNVARKLVDRCTRKNRSVEIGKDKAMSGTMSARNEEARSEVVRDDDDEEEWEVIVLMKLPSGTTWKKVLWYYSWPINTVLRCTVPDCRRKTFRSMYPVTFLMSVVWTGAATYFVTWMISIIGATFGASDSVMGLTLIAAGGNIPETVSSIIMVRRGFGSMGLSNAMASNTLDILLCLSIPWLIKCLLTSNTSGTINIQSRGLYINCLFQIGCVVLLYLTILIFRFRMNRALGAACVLMYVFFIVLAVLIETNVFFVVNSETCIDRN